MCMLSQFKKKKKKKKELDIKEGPGPCQISEYSQDKVLENCVVMISQKCALCIVDPPRSRQSPFWSLFPNHYQHHLVI